MEAVVITAIICVTILLVCLGMMAFAVWPDKHYLRQGNQINDLEKRVKSLENTRTTHNALKGKGE